MPYPDAPRVDLATAYNIANDDAAAVAARSQAVGCRRPVARALARAAFEAKLADVLPTAPAKSHPWPPDLPTC